MLERVSEDIKAAMKAKDKGRLDALRLLKSAFIENNTSSQPKADLDVAIAHVKKLRDSLEAYPQGSPEQEKIKTEIEYLASYVPQAMSKEDLQVLVRSVIEKNASADFGLVMKAISGEIKGRFDGREASQIVKSMLA